MSTDLMLSNIQLPAHLRGAQDNTTDSLMVAGPSFPRLSIKQGRFRLCKGGEEHLIKLDEFQVVIVAATPLQNIPAKIFYSQAYTAGDAEAPDCVSSDGIRPDANVANPQCATTCAVCPMNAWGSAKTNDGRDAKACKDTKALYFVVPDGDGINEEVVQVRVPTMSLRHLSKYAAALKSRKIPVSSVITKLSFDETKEYPELLFNFGGFLSEDQYNSVRDVAAGDTIAQVLNGEISIVVEDEAAAMTAGVEVEEEEEDVAPPKKKPAKKEPAKSVFEEDDDLGEVEEDDEDEEEVEVDADGRVWDERIDSSNRKKGKNGKWMRRKNLTDEAYLKIKKQLLGKAPKEEEVPATKPKSKATPQPADDDMDAELDALLADLG